MSDSPLVAYIWSQTLQEAADQLPYNLGRSTLGHDLIRSLDLLDGTSGSSPTDEHGEGDSDRHEDEETALHLRSRSIEKGKGNLRSRARVIEPDMSLGTAQSLRRYHDSDYVGVCVRLRLAPF
jgi:histone deacetylase 1/2